jgi:hypothetical protein
MLDILFTQRDGFCQQCRAKKECETELHEVIVLVGFKTNFRGKKIMEFAVDGRSFLLMVLCSLQ